MEPLLAQVEAPVRLGLFLIAFAALATWEIAAPRRALSVSRHVRWSTNLAILVLNTTTLRLIAPAAAVGIALLAEQSGIGLLHAVRLPHLLTIVLAVIALDLAIYFQHVLFHAVPLLWRLHRVHHADLDFDVTTGTRFHPIEILMSLAIKAAAILVIGAPALAVLVFEVMLNLASMFNHSNVRIPAAVDAVLRWFVVTPDMHRVHHSIHRDETDRNFGFSLPWWDRIFGTYRSQPRDAHETMLIGIPEFRDPRQCVTVSGVLSLPFVVAHNQNPTTQASPAARIDQAT